MSTGERKLVSLAGLNAGGCTVNMSPLDGVVFNTLLTVFYVLVEPVRDLPWLGQPRVDDEWSGLSE